MSPLLNILGDRLVLLPSDNLSVQATLTDADDISHYVKALNYGLNRLKEEKFPFVLHFIRELHKELMLGARQTHFSDPGEFRKTQNFIGGTRPDNASFVPPAPLELDAPLKDFENFIHKP